MKIKLFDGHCDTIMRCYNTDSEYYNGGSMRQNTGHVSLLEAKEHFGGYAQFFAIFAETGMIPGKTYAQMFEEEYAKLITLDKYSENQNRDLEVSLTHNGYFASDKKKER